MPEPVKYVLQLQFQSIKESLHQFELAKQGEVIAAEHTSMDTPAVSVIAEKKITFLISYLQQVAKDFEMIGDELEDKNLKQAFLSLSEENRQFAQDLQCQAKHLGVPLLPAEYALFVDNEFPETSTDSRTTELLHICDKSEYLFLKLYTDALKEFLGIAKLKDLMIFQYNSIRAGFVKVRMLNSLRFNNELSYM